MFSIGFDWPITWTGYRQVKIKLVRLETTDHGIFGHLSIDSDPFNCVTLERHDIAIPKGSYRVTLYDSPEHGVVPLLHDVPDSTYVEIHEGNWEFNSKKCILVGETRALIEGKEGITASRTTKKALVDKLKGADDIWLSIC